MASNSSNVYNRRGPGPVPPRWLNCPRKSTMLIGPKFLAFKTPLSHCFDSAVPAANQFTPSMLLASMKSYKVKIGLWIDLTNTDRFYDRNEVEKEGVKYLKLQCRGHGQCPSVEQVNTFVEVCDRFIRQNPLEIIAVHCTHGFNRTGFMIASYYIMKEDWSCDLAVKTFANARPPGIYKNDYIMELFARFDEPDAAPPPPELPDWCYEDKNSDSEDDEKSNSNDKSRMRNNVNGGRKKFRRVKDPVFMEGVSGVTPLLEEPKLSAIQSRIQKMCNWQRGGFPGCQPVSMTQENLSCLAAKQYKVSWKADGTRYMMLIDSSDGSSEVYFADRDHSIFVAHGVEFRYKYDLRKHLCDTLVDGEMVIDVDPRTGAKFPRYLIYDAVRIHSKDIANDNFQLRFDRIDTDIIRPRNAACEKGFINKAKQPFSVRRKDFWDANPQTTSKLLSQQFKQQLLHEPDGLIFQPCPDPYISGQCDSVLKWKPSSHNSVDFRVKVVVTKEIGCPTTTVGQLFVGGLPHPFATMKATKAVRELDGKIIECTLKDGKWVLMRERTDKSYPNSYTTAASVCSSIVHPVTEEMLIQFIENHGFKKPDEELMPPPKIAPKTR